MTLWDLGTWKCSCVDQQSPNQTTELKTSVTGEERRDGLKEVAAAFSVSARR